MIKGILSLVYSFSLSNGEILTSFIKKNNFRNYVEVGVWKGDTLSYIANHNKILNKISGIDPYEVKLYGNDMKGCMALESQETFDKVYRKVIERFKGNPNIKIIKKTSKEASMDFKDNSVDLVFIDADHSYKSVKDDINLWLPKVRKGGILAGHDYYLKFFGVIQAVHEAFGIDNIGIKGIIWWTFKK